MEDFKIIFYIAVAIAWIVYKNYQKVIQNRPKVNEDIQTQKDFSGAEKKEKYPVERIKQRQKPVIATVQPPDKNLYKSKEVKKVKSNFREELKKNIPAEFSPILNPITKKYSASPIIIGDPEVKEEMIEQEKEISDKSIFDLKNIDIRTAIVWSEILKRQYL